MIATALVKDVLWRAASLLQDTTPQYERNPEAELIDWFNDAQIAITKFLPAACSRIDAIKLKANSTLQSIESIAATDCMPGDGSTPTVPVIGNMMIDILCNMGTNGLTPGKSIRLTERNVLDSQSPLWHANSGTAVSSWMFDPRFPRQFLITPALTAPVWVRAGFTAQPLKIPNGGAPGAEIYAKSGASTQTITVSDEHVDDITNYLVARSNMRKTEWADTNKATVFSQMFLGSLNAKVMAITGNNPNLTQLPFAPEPIGRAK